MDKNSFADKLFIKGRVVTPDGIYENRVVETDGSRISFVGEHGQIFPGEGHRVFDFGPNFICPGFIDIHVHGAGGGDVMDGTFEALNRMSEQLAAGGTTSFLATTMSDSRTALAAAVKNADMARSRGTAGARIIGVHLEGPFLNPLKKGAHREKDLRLPDVSELAGYIDTGRDLVRMITIAPELPGATEVIQYARSRGVIISLGHSTATITQVEEACGLGLSHVTHAFNAMAGLHHRDPGTAGAVMSMRQLSVDIIPDGHHVHPSIIKILVRAKGIDAVSVITDSIRAGGLGDGSFELWGRMVKVVNGRACLADQTIVGSTISMAQAVRNIVEDIGLPLDKAVRMASTNPAKFLGLGSKGVLAPGSDADIVVLDHNYRVLLTVAGGKVIYGG